MTAPRALRVRSLVGRGDYRRGVSMAVPAPFGRLYWLTEPRDNGKT